MNHIKPAEFQLPQDLAPDERTVAGTAILPLTADAIALYIKTKSYHWHMCGPHFKEYHELLDDQAGQIFEMIDVLAERSRKLGQTTIRSIGHVAALTNVQDDRDGTSDPLAMLRQLAEDNAAFTKRMREAHGCLEEAEDIATASVLENFIDEAERRTWFLVATLTRDATTAGRRGLIGRGTGRREGLE
jgi:starvation-inducible DNA-binding protein